MDLYFKEYGQGHPLIILHGLFGMGDNWAGIARRLGEKFMCFTPDLRNHGKSEHIPEMNYSAMAEDIKNFMESHWVYNGFVMGHSMGGKVAMKLALEFPDKVDKLIVVDIAPRKYEPGHEEILEAMHSLENSEIKSRQDAHQLLAQKIKEDGVIQFLLKNLYFDKSTSIYGWKMNLPIIYKYYDRILEELSSKNTFEKPVLFIKGEHSSYIQDKDEEEIKKLFPQAIIKSIASAGHWVHADQPEALMELIIEFLQKD